MSAHHAEAPFPLAPLRGAAALVLVSFTLAAVGRLTGMYHADVPTAPILAQHELRFEDRPHGSIAVYEDGATEPSTVVGSGTNGFLRGTMRALARDRNQHEMGRDTPFILTAYQDGRLTLEDPAVGRLVDLEAFGPTNAAAFARLIGLGGQP